MPNANNIIIYNAASRLIEARLSGDTDQVILSSGQAMLVSDYTDPIDGKYVNAAKTDVEPMLQFSNGFWATNTQYKIPDLPNNTTVAVSGDNNNEYNVSGSIQIYIPYYGFADISVSAPGYSPRIYSVANPHTQSGGGGGGFGGGIR